MTSAPDGVRGPATPEGVLNVSVRPEELARASPLSYPAGPPVIDQRVAPPQYASPGPAMHHEGPVALIAYNHPLEVSLAIY